MCKVFSYNGLASRLRPADRDPIDRSSPYSSEASGRLAIGWVASQPADGYPEAGVHRKLFFFKDLDCQTHRESPILSEENRKVYRSNDLGSLETLAINSPLKNT